MDANPVEESIKHSITKHGFPEKTVNLPFRPVFESCKRHETPLARVLENLKKEGISGTIRGDVIEFRSPAQPRKEAPRISPQDTNFMDPAWLAGLGGFQDLAREKLAQMSPEQLAEVRKTVENMSDEEKQNILKMISQMVDPSR